LTKRGPGEANKKAQSQGTEAIKRHKAEERSKVTEKALRQ